MMYTKACTHNNPLLKGVFFFYVLLLIVQDLSLQTMVGTIARSPYVFLSPIIFILILLQSGKFFSYKHVNIYVVYFIYSLLVSSAFLIYYLGFRQIDNYVYGENLVIKFFKASMYNLIIIITLYNFFYIFQKQSSIFILSLLKSLIVIQLLVGFVEVVFPGALSVLKTPELFPMGRLSLLCSEPSSAYPLLLVSYALYTAFKMYTKGRFTFVDILIAVATITLLLLIQSRGGLVNTLFCVAIIVLFTRQSFKAKLFTLTGALVVVIPIVYVITQTVLPSLLLDLEEFNSVSTRSITIAASLKSLVVYPFGQGYSTYLLTFPKVLIESMNWVLDLVPIPLATSEIDEMITTGRALTVKSGLLNEALYSGWMVIFLYFFLFGFAYKQIKVVRDRNTLSMVLRFILLFVIINYLFVSSIETSYIAFLPFALISRIYWDVKGISKT